MNTPADDDTLAALQREFPRFRIWLEPVHGHYRFIARRQYPGTGLHTIITADPAELRTALAAAPQPRHQATTQPFLTHDQAVTPEALRRQRPFPQQA